MSSTTIILIAVPVFVLAVIALFFSAARRRDTDKAIGQLSHETMVRDRGRVSPTEAEEAPPTTGREIERLAAMERRGTTTAVEKVERAPVAWVPPDAEQLGVSRRQFFNRSIVTLFGVGLGGFGAASGIAFLWPNAAGGFGSVIKIGKISDIQAKIKEGNGFAYYPEARMWVTEFPPEAMEKASAVYTPPELAAMEAGIVPLYQKCPHLGCRVPNCPTSQWFECPCHGSQYNQVGEKKGGPAPRGMDRFAATVSGGQLEVNTGLVINGPPIGTNTTGQEAEGPHCVSGGGGH